MPWWLAVLNSLLGVVSTGFGAVAVIRPQTLAPLLGHGGKGGRFYPAMYAARSVPLGLLVAAFVWLAPAESLTLLVLAAAAAAQLGDAVIGAAHRMLGMVVFPLASAVLHLAGATYLL